MTRLYVTQQSLLPRNPEIWREAYGLCEPIPNVLCRRLPGVYGAEVEFQMGLIAFIFDTDADAVAFKLKHCDDFTFVEGGAA